MGAGGSRNDRRAGLLLHPTSLPGPHGSGDLGASARAWIDFLAAAGQRLWQVLPLGPTGYGDSPYQAFSAFAGNPLLIDPERLADEGLLERAELAPPTDLPTHRVDYGRVIPHRYGLLGAAADRFAREAGAEQRRELAEFREAQRHWLPDYALYRALKEENEGRPWNEWPAGVRLRRDQDLAAARDRLAASVLRHELWQWLFYRQWHDLKRYANDRDIQVIGDLPIFVAFDSADTWANPEQFQLDGDLQPTHVAGVPPDYFSATGQLWGNPLYSWDRMADGGYAWWTARFEAAFDLFDVVRVDHFRGFEAYWAVPAGETTAERGRWEKGPGQAFFDVLHRRFGDLPIIAEDLGHITPAVEELRTANGLPGMRVLQFAFAGGSDDPYLPHNYDRNTVAYTGTHDNDTTRGWYDTAPEAERDHARRYLGRSDDDIHWEFMRLALASVADRAVVPLQDVLGLGSAARMNTPGSEHGNWEWRLQPAQLQEWVAPALRELVILYGRDAGGRDGAGGA